MLTIEEMKQERRKAWHRGFAIGLFLMLLTSVNGLLASRHAYRLLADEAKATTYYYHLSQDYYTLAEQCVLMKHNGQ